MDLSRGAKWWKVKGSLTLFIHHPFGFNQHRFNDMMLVYALKYQSNNNHNIDNSILHVSFGMLHQPAKASAGL